MTWRQAKNTTQIFSMKDVKDEAGANREIRGEETLASFTMTGRKIAPNTGANATKFFTLATKS